MSRQPINAAWESLSGMEGITISDPSRLRINFGGSKGANNNRVVWPTVEPLQVTKECKESEEVVLDVSSVIGRKTEVPACKRPGLQLELPSWVLALGYALFGIALAVGNAVPLQVSGRVCAAACPLPLVCLLLQAATSPLFPGLVLLACALLLPAVCALESLPIAVGGAGLLLLSIGALTRCQRRGVLVYVSFAGAVLSLGLPLLEARMGLSTASFFLCVLCAVSCERTHVKVWV